MDTKIFVDMLSKVREHDKNSFKILDSIMDLFSNINPKPDPLDFYFACIRLLATKIQAMSELFNIPPDILKDSTFKLLNAMLDDSKVDKENVH